jgi:hypothetical protein
MSKPHGILRDLITEARHLAHINDLARQDQFARELHPTRHKEIVGALRVSPAAAEAKVVEIWRD